MMALLHRIISILITIEFFLGTMSNGFIVLVNCIDWIKRQKISSVDQVLTALAVSRIGLLWIILLNWHNNVLNSVSLNLYVTIFVSIAYLLANHFSVWFATVLSIFYLLKIANFSSFLFLYLKRRVKSVMIIILLVSLSFLSLNFGIAGTDNIILTNRRSMTHNTTMMEVAHISSLTIFTLTNLIPFTMSLISLVLLIVSLSIHLKKMQVNGKGSQDPSTKVHIRAMQTVTSFLLLFAGYILALIVTVWNSNNLKNSSVFMFCQIFGIMYPSKHSFVLIWGNKKLKHIFLSFLWHLRCQLKVRK